MSEQTAQSTALGVILVAGAVVVWDNIKHKGKASPGGKQLVSFSILAAVLMLVATVAPGLGGPLALLVGIAVVIARIGK